MTEDPCSWEITRIHHKNVTTKSLRADGSVIDAADRFGDAMEMNPIHLFPPFKDRAAASYDAGTLHNLTPHISVER
jgi:hypothetical protein